MSTNPDPDVGWCISPVLRKLIDLASSDEDRDKLRSDELYPRAEKELKGEGDGVGV